MFAFFPIGSFHDPSSKYLSLWSSQDLYVSISEFVCIYYLALIIADIAGFLLINFLYKSSKSLRPLWNMGSPPCVLYLVQCLDSGGPSEHE